MHGVLVVDEVGLRGGHRSGVETWTERLSSTERQSVTHTESGSACCSSKPRKVWCFMCVEQLKRSVLFYVSRATESWQSPEEALLSFTCVEQLKRRMCLNG